MAAKSTGIDTEQNYVTVTLSTTKLTAMTKGLMLHQEHPVAERLGVFAENVLPTLLTC